MTHLRTGRFADYYLELGLGSVSRGIPATYSGVKGHLESNPLTALNNTLKGSRLHQNRILRGSGE